MKPIDHEAIVMVAKRRASAADNFLDQLQTVPVHWTALCDAAHALTDVWATHISLDAETKAIVADAVGLGEVPLNEAISGLHNQVRGPSPALLKLLEMLYPKEQS